MFTDQNINCSNPKIALLICFGEKFLIIIFFNLNINDLRHKNEVHLGQMSKKRSRDSNELLFAH